MGSRCIAGKKNDYYWAVMRIVLHIAGLIIGSLRWDRAIAKAGRCGNSTSNGGSCVIHAAT